jgi:hypothetical protein
MHHRSWRRRALAAALVVAACAPLGASEFVHPDHHEFDATLGAPFRAKATGVPVVLRFDYPTAGRATAAAWTLEAIAPDGRVVRAWQGMEPLHARKARVELAWDGRGRGGRALAAGYYTLRLRAAPTVLTSEDKARPLADRVAEAFAAFPDELHEQRYDVMLGDVAPARMPAFDPLPVGARAPLAAKAQGGAPVTALSQPATAGLPYTIYYGNFHSQTNHSDGGGALGSCTSSQGPQAGAFGPDDAFAMMHTQAGGDFLLASEHNHMYDGSTGTATSANPATAIALFDSGLQAASAYRAANPGFMALYGLEWGVISNGGHLNILNADALPNWEFNCSGQLIG